MFNPREKGAENGLAKRSLHAITPTRKRLLNIRDLVFYTVGVTAGISAQQIVDQYLSHPPPQTPPHCCRDIRHRGRVYGGSTQPSGMRGKLRSRPKGSKAE